jgi:hypothetical protein
MFERLDDLIFRRGRFLIYLLGMFFIIYLDRYDFEKIFYTFYSILKITVIWLVLFLIPRVYFLEQIKNFNKWVVKNFGVLIRLRKIIIDFELIFTIILSLYIFIDMFLIKILLLYTRKRTWFYFIRRLFYYNILLVLVLPFFFIKELYTVILYVINGNVSIKNYLELRLHFLLLSIIFVLLFDIERIDIIIICWVVDTILIVYYKWWDGWKVLKVDNNLKEKDVRQYCSLLMFSFKDINLEYNDLACIFLKGLGREETILLFKGLNYEEDILNNNLNLYLIFWSYYERFWNNYYACYLNDQAYTFKYYDINNDEHFILFIFSEIIVEGCGDNKEEFKDNLNNLEFDYVIGFRFDKRFHLSQYNMMLNLVNKFKENNKLVDEFFVLKNKYNFDFFKDYTKEEDVSKFLLKLKN